MTEELKVAVDRKDNGAVLYTKGYINNVGGEEIAVRAERGRPPERAR